MKTLQPPRCLLDCYGRLATAYPKYICLDCWQIQDKIACFFLCLISWAAQPFNVAVQQFQVFDDKVTHHWLQCTVHCTAQWNNIN